MSLSRPQAKKLAMKLATEGRTREQIGVDLEKAGYINRKGGPLGKGAVGELLNSPGKRHARRSPEAKAAATVIRTNRSSSARLSAVQKILGIKDMSSDDRIALIHIMLGV